MNGVMDSKRHDLADSHFVVSITSFVCWGASWVAHTHRDSLFFNTATAPGKARASHVSLSAEVAVLACDAAEDRHVTRRCANV